MDYPKHTPLIAAIAAAAIGGISLARPQSVTVAAPRMVGVGPHELLERREPRADCEKACAHLRELKCTLGDSLYCVVALQDGTTPLAPHVTASCEEIQHATECP